MKTAVINVSAFVTDENLSCVLNRGANIRRKTLNACYQIPGYEELPLNEKNAIYDAICKIFEEIEGKESK
jgi:hypothetical protein